MKKVDVRMLTESRKKYQPISTKFNMIFNELFYIYSDNNYQANYQH